jgi:hypothetical protein
MMTGGAYLGVTAQTTERGTVFIDMIVLTRRRVAMPLEAGIWTVTVSGDRGKTSRARWLPHGPIAYWSMGVRWDKAVSDERSTIGIPRRRITASR